MGGIATSKITTFWWKRKRKRGSGSGGSGPKIDRFQNTGSENWETWIKMELTEMRKWRKASTAKEAKEQTDEQLSERASKTLCYVEKHVLIRLI